MVRASNIGLLLSHPDSQLLCSDLCCQMLAWIGPSLCGVTRFQHRAGRAYSILPLFLEMVECRKVRRQSWDCTFCCPLCHSLLDTTLLAAFYRVADFFCSYSNSCTIGKAVGVGILPLGQSCNPRASSVQVPVDQV